MSNHSTNLPQVTRGVVYTAQASITINASVDRVWDVLLDFSRYTEWNPFVRSQVIVDKSKRPLSDQTPTEGALLLMTVEMKPSSYTKSLEVITAIDRAQHRIAWRFLPPLPRWILHAERWQALSVIDDGGEQHVLYESREEFLGLAAYLIKWFAGKDVVRGFENTALALKERAERT